MLVLFAASLLGGALLGYRAGGRLRSAADIHLHHVWLLFASVAIQFTLAFARSSLGTGTATVVTVATYICVGLWLATNARSGRALLRLGMTVISVGWLLNVLAIAPNGAMPVSAKAVQAASQHSGTSGANVRLSKHVSGPDRPLGWLGDIAPVPALRVVVSVGDLFLLAGVSLALAGAMKGHGAPRLATVRATL